MNNLGIESGTCTWATPINTWSSPSDNEVNTVAAKVPFKSRLWKLLSKLLSSASAISVTGRIPRRSSPCTVVNRGYTNGPLILTPEPANYVTTEQLPTTWDWRDINGVNYLSWTVNQHIPRYCGSCWAQGTISALSDRFIIADKVKYNQLALSPQVILNCRAGGSCEGGNPGSVYEFVNEIGVPDMT